MESFYFCGKNISEYKHLRCERIQALFRLVFTERKRVPMLDTDASLRERLPGPLPWLLHPRTDTLSSAM